MPRVRNIGIIAHIDAGKTTVSERFLFYSGKEHRMGEVHEGTAHMDYLVEEQERGITITSAATTLLWQDATINLIDTPGHVDFTAEVERSLRVLDGAIGVFCGVAGVEAQSETVWRQADHYRVPRLAFINKLDRVGADYFRVLEEIQERLRCRVLPLVVPIGTEGDFRGLVDLVTGQALTFSEETLGRTVVEIDLPPEMQPIVERWRGELIERVSQDSDEVTELFLGGREVPVDLLRKVIRAGTIAHRWVPVLGGAAFRNKGIQLLLDAVIHYLPAPEDLPPVEGTDLEGKKRLQRPLDVAAPFAGLVFKVQVDAHGELSFMRVYSGRIERGAVALNPRAKKRERLMGIYRMHAAQREALEEAVAGDIVAVIGLRCSVTGDTLCDQKQPIALESLTFPETVISMAIEPRSASERDRLIETLSRLAKEDPTFRTQLDPDTGQVIMSGMGELHLEVIRNRLLRDFKVDAKIGKPRVSYRQAFCRPGRKRAHIERLVGGKTHVGEVDIELVPDSTIRCVIVEWGDAGEVPLPWRQGVQDTLRACADSGGDLGFSYVQARLTLRVPVMTPETTEVGLSLAVREAFQELEESAGNLLLEPVMRFQVVTPEEYFGAINQDLIRRRAVVENVDTSQGLRRLGGSVPLSEVFGYTTTLRSLSQGRATMTLEPIGYGAAPEDVAKKFRL